MPHAPAPSHVRVRLGRRFAMIERPAIIGQKLVVAYGMGTDSTAMLVLLHRQGIRPDAILFADTGSEKRATYDYLPTINAWLASVGFPLVTVVRIASKHASLGANCLTNETLPFVSFHKHTCSQKWKIAAQEKHLNSDRGAALTWAAGMPVVKLIGYDASGADCKRRGKADKATARRHAKGKASKEREVYPLQEAGLTRADCLELIRSAGLPDPGKSACSFCPSMKPAEIVDLAQHEPEKAAEALKIEATAAAGRHGLGKCKGLGIAFNWYEFLRSKHPAILARLEASHDCGQEQRAALARIRAEREPAAPTITTPTTADPVRPVDPPQRIGVHPMSFILHARTLSALAAHFSNLAKAPSVLGCNAKRRASSEVTIQVEEDANGNRFLRMEGNDGTRGLPATANSAVRFPIPDAFAAAHVVDLLSLMGRADALGDIATAGPAPDTHALRRERDAIAAERDALALKLADACTLLDAARQSDHSAELAEARAEVEALKRTVIKLRALVLPPTPDADAADLRDRREAKEAVAQEAQVPAPQPTRRATATDLRPAAPPILAQLRARSDVTVSDDGAAITFHGKQGAGVADALKAAGYKWDHVAHKASQLNRWTRA